MSYALAVFFLIISVNCSVATPIDYEPGTLIIKLQKEKEKKTRVLALNKKWGATVQTFHLKSAIPIYSLSSKLISGQDKKDTEEHRETVMVLSFSDDVDINRIKSDYRHSGAVRSVEPNYYVYLNARPFPLHTNQYHIQHPSLLAMPMVNSEINVPVALIDTGLDILHPALRHALYINHQEIPFNNYDDDGNGYIDDYYGLSFLGYSATQKPSSDISDLHGHGTHIAGIIAAKSVNNSGVWGVNPQAMILPIKFMDSTGKGTQLDAAMAIRYAVDRGVKVINCSWGYFKKTTVLEDAIEYAIKKGVIIVSSVGNSYSYIREFPSAFNHVITVGAVSPDLTRSAYSSYGSHLDFMSFGTDIYSTLPGNNYGTQTGTSQATAIVSGIISKALSLYPAMSKLGVYELLKSNSHDIGAPGYDIKSGHGVVYVDGIIKELGASPASYTVVPVSPKTETPSRFKPIWVIIGILIAIMVGGAV
jgi:serine protease